MINIKNMVHPMGILHPKISRFFRDDIYEAKDLPEKMLNTLLRDAHTINKHINIMLINQDEDEYLLIKEALKNIEVSYDIKWLQDCDGVRRYMMYKGHDDPHPDLILLDIHMYKDDEECISLIKELRENIELKDILIVVLGSPLSQQFVRKAYQLGINSYIPKTHNFKKLSETVQILSKYWFEVVELPRHHHF